MDNKTRFDRNAARRKARKTAADRREKLLATYERRLAKQREYTKAWKKANPERVAEQQRRYYLKKAQERAAAAPKTAQIYPVQAENYTLPTPIVPESQSSTSSDPTVWADFWKSRLAAPAMPAPEPQDVDKS